MESAQSQSKNYHRHFAVALWAAALVLAAFVLGTGPEWKGVYPDQFDGKSHSLEFMLWGLWWASVINLPLCIALALTARKWASPTGPEAPDRASPNVSTGWRRREWLFLAIILLTAGAVRWARMDLSLYNDEAHTFRRYIAGQMAKGKAGEPKWRQAKWMDTYCLNTVGNNSPPFSLLSRLSYETWHKATGASAGEVNETALRLPSLLSGMASLVIFWAFLRRLSSRTVAWWGLIFCAFHPWHVRYSSEARGLWSADAGDQPVLLLLAASTGGQSLALVAGTGCGSGLMCH